MVDQDDGEQKRQMAVAAAVLLVAKVPGQASSVPRLLAVDLAVQFQACCPAVAGSGATDVTSCLWLLDCQRLHLRPNQAFLETASSTSPHQQLLAGQGCKPLHWTQNSCHAFHLVSLESYPPSAHQSSRHCYCDLPLLRQDCIAAVAGRNG